MIISELFTILGIKLCNLDEISALYSDSKMYVQHSHIPKVTSFGPFYEPSSDL
jgi:hypothetical protein